MKRKLVLFILTLSIGKSLFSQVTHSLTIGPDLGLGANFGKAAKASVGGSVEYVAKISSKLGIRLSSGYNKFNDKYDDGWVSFLPFRAGIQGFIYEDLIFVFGEAGIANYKASTGTNKTGPSFAIGAGYRLPIANSQFIQLSSYFNFYRYKGDPPGGDFNYTWFNFRAAYGLSFRKKNKSEKD